MQRQKGFTLIELMIAVVVVSILAMIAMPSYNNYVRRGKIPDATANLATKRVQQEQSFQDNRTYVGGTGCVADTATSQYFDFSCTGVTAATYVLQAVGKGSMAGFTYTLDQNNSKATTVTGVAGWSGNASCWVTKEGGAC